MAQDTPRITTGTRGAYGDGGESKVNPNRPTCEQRKRGPLHPRGSEPAVSGSDSREPDRQKPAESREFLGLTLDARGKSLQPAD